MFIVWCSLAVLTALAFYRGKIFLAKPEDVVRDKLGLPEPAAAPADPEKAATPHAAH
jgi:hypothetical protein